MRLPRALYAPPIAHRGLWSPGRAPENSLAAFEAACRAGYGIELDVRLSADGEAMVFHDEGLDRMAGLDVALETLTAAELCGIRLAGSEEAIPTLAQTLQLVSDRAMLLVEIKSGPSGAGPLAERTAELLGRHHGPSMAISFDALALAWLAEHRPALARGLDFVGLEDPAMAEHFDRACDLAEPDALVLQLKSAMTGAAQQRRASGQPVLAWTARSPLDAAQAAGAADNIIFEGFRA